MIKLGVEADIYNSPRTHFFSYSIYSLPVLGSLILLAVNSSFYFFASLGLVSFFLGVYCLVAIRIDENSSYKKGIHPSHYNPQFLRLAAYLMAIGITSLIWTICLVFFVY